MNKKLIIIVSVSALVLLIVLIVVYYMGKKSKFIASQTKIGKDEAGTTVLTQDEIDKLKSLAVSLYNDMDGLNILGFDVDLYDRVSLLSDTKLVALSNIFNAMYEKENETFIQYLKSEGFRLWLPSLAVKVNTIITRLGTLGVM